MIYLYLGSLAIALITLWILNHDIASPVIVSGIIWFGLYALLLFTDERKLVEDYHFSYFLIAYFSFLIGFTLVCNKYVISFQYENEDITYNSFLYLLFTLICYICGAIIILSARGIGGSGFSLWAAFRGSEQMISLSNGILAPLVNFIQVFFLSLFAISLYNTTSKNIIRWIVLLPPLITEMLLESRGTWFFLLISILFEIIYIKRFRSKKIIGLGLLLVLLVALIFIYSSLSKFSNAWTQMSNEDKIRNLFLVYFVSPSISFVELMDRGVEFQFGTHIFRFFFAVAHSFNPSIEVVDTVQDFISTDTFSSNVYTAIHWYYVDFGLPGIIAVELILGIVYALLYKRVISGVKIDISNLMFSTILLSMLMYPIINQFFDEKLFSILSIWIQRVIWLFIFTRKGFTIKESSEDRRIMIKMGEKKLEI